MCPVEEFQLLNVYYQVRNYIATFFTEVRQTFEPKVRIDLLYFLTFWLIAGEA